MAKIELIKQFRGRAKYEKLGGSRPHIFSYDLGKYYRANKVTEFMKEKADKIPKSESLFFATNARYYNLNNKTMFSDYSSKDKINVAPSYLEDSQVNIEDSMIRFISLYVLDKNPNIYGKKKTVKKRLETMNIMIACLMQLLNVLIINLIYCLVKYVGHLGLSHFLD